MVGLCINGKIRQVDDYQIHSNKTMMSVSNTIPFTPAIQILPSTSDIHTPVLVENIIAQPQTSVSTGSSAFFRTLWTLQIGKYHLWFCTVIIPQLEQRLWSGFTMTRRHWSIGNGNLSSILGPRSLDPCVSAFVYHALFESQCLRDSVTIP